MHGPASMTIRHVSANTWTSHSPRPVWSLVPVCPSTFWNTRASSNKQRMSYLRPIHHLENSKLQFLLFLNSNEKNFHIFYYLCEGLGAENKLGDYFLDTGRRAHRYVTLPPLTSLDRQVENIVKTKFRFSLLHISFVFSRRMQTNSSWYAKDSLNWDSPVTNSIQSIPFWRLSFILATWIWYQPDQAMTTLTDVVLQMKTKSKSVRISVSHALNISIQIGLCVQFFSFYKVAKLLGVQPNAVTEALTSVSVVTRGETITRHNGVDAACSTREAMAKGLYSRLFDWLVQQINRHLSFGRLV